MNTSEDLSRVWPDLSALLALCAALRLGYVWLVPRTLDSADAVLYLETARHLASGDVGLLDPKIPLLYPAAVAIAHQFIPDIESAGRAVSWIFSTLLVVPVYLVSRELHGRSSARVAGVIIAFWPWLIDYCSRVATEPLAVTLFMGGVAAMIFACKRDASVSRMIMAGTCFGLLHLARPEGMFILLAAPFALLVFGPMRVQRPLLGLAAYAAPALVALLLNTAVTHAATGVWSLNYRMGFIGDAPEGSTVLRDFARTLVGMSADVPAVMLGPLLWAFFGIGAALPGPRPRDTRAEWSVLYFAIVQWVVVLPVLSPAPRYLMSALVLCAIWSARGIDRASATLRQAGRGLLAFAPPAAVVLWMCFHSAAQVVRERMRDDQTRPAQPWEYKIAGEWMAAHLDPGLIATRKPQIGFYARMPTIGLPADATIEDVFDIAAKGGLRYLVVDERYTADLVPALKPLLDPAAAPDRLRLVSDTASPYAAARVVIYEFPDHPK